MTLTENEFRVLVALATSRVSSQRNLSKRCGISLGSTNSAYRALTQAGLARDFTATERGLQALEPYRVENAVIMAAGLSSRFAPISYEKPKGLLKVRGDVLIERQIEQLQAAGIRDITVVVGYKKEYFFYLEDAYGVRIVVNADYASRNNNSTLKVVERMLGNTYICSSDDYFTENPFEPYVYHAYYAAQHAQGYTPEWCLEVAARDRIVGVTVGGADAWYMIGHAYFDRAFSRRFVEILDAEYDLPETAGKLWENLFVEHIDELDMRVRRYEPGTIFEFDSLDEVRAFDPHFLENLDSEVFDNIVRALGCAKDEICDVYPLKQGLTNLSCHFRTNDGAFVYRHPGVGTENLIDRAAEHAALVVARGLGLDDTFVCGDPVRGWKISRFVEDAVPLNPHDDDQLALAMHVAARLHAADARVERTFDFYEEGKRYESLLETHGPIDVPGYHEMAEIARKVRAHAAADGARTCLAHNDFFHLNFLIDGKGKASLIDWEYAGMSDYANDFGTFVVCSSLSEDEADRALEHYFGRTPTFAERRHNFAFVGLAGWCWYVWSLVKEADGDFVGESLYLYYDYARRYLNRVLSWYEGEGAKEGGAQ
ncbi:MAG: phosphotransferase [Eggerthellaceae bacterium]|nr:phosphotransferase [Eggerthellaceae bacterium]